MSQYALRWVVAWRRVAWRRRTRIVDPVQQVRAVVPDAVDRPTDRPEMYQTVVGWLHEAGWVPCPLPSHTGKCSSSRITGIPSYSACIVALAGVVRTAKLRTVSLFGPASPPHRQTPAVRRPSGELHKAACRPASRAIRKRHLHAPGTGGVPGR